jgi:sterol desaturase/sphingolipid hydroxylase (fatty acid hydroxylase superfamily)
LFFFLTTLTTTFWRGELVWHAKPVESQGADIFYVISTGVFILASGLGLVMSRGRGDKRHRFVLGISFGVLVVSVLFLAVLSMLFDFHDCWAP